MAKERRKSGSGKRGSKTLKRIILCVEILVLVVMFYGLWYYFRPQPAPITKPLFQGVTYQRETRRTPRPLVFHTVKIDLKAEGIRLFVTPGDREAALPLTARKTSDFLKEFKLQVAVNGDFFFPFKSNHIFDYYPRVGERVELEGYAWSNGNNYSFGGERWKFPMLYFSQDNRINFSLSPHVRPKWQVWNGISGICMLVRDGKESIPFPGMGKIDPCVALAASKDERYLYIFVAEGRQSNYSAGLNFKEMADMIIERGGWNAIALDGGGSQTLVMEGAGGGVEFLNTTIDHRIPGWERPVANHIGVYAAPLPTTK